MFTIQEAQAMDYLLKSLLNRQQFPYYEKSLKLVIEVKGTYWSGDFINYSSGDIHQSSIYNDGDVERQYLYTNSQSDLNIFEKIKATYQSEVNKYSWTNPFLRITDLGLLFNALIELVKTSDVKHDDSPIYPYLLNAKSLDGQLELPFINLNDDTVKLVSIVELKQDEN